MDFLLCVCLLQLLFLRSSPVAAQQPTPSPARALDAMLQEYAYRALVRPRTGIVYNATVPGNLTGVSVSALRLRSGSLRRKGLSQYFQFGLPTGVIAQPRVERMLLVYHNLGNWSQHYYPPPPGYTYLSPVLGLLAYDAANLSAVGLPELNIVASGSPILVHFSNVRAAPAGRPAPRSRHKRAKKLEVMERNSEVGETLRMAQSLTITNNARRHGICPSVRGC
ncbi:hypothetical protein TRIUR3_28903 [Triticum urartu]|uniref:rRNA N-glycosidase n=2 Tax=Triticum TaxID=4564 RepID=A0A9R0TRG1_TRITD|nr:hypothetical protein TRIUR3_28903 [Triticum urartu]VAI15990.1 unnamed protein product [Triticum turgidum subsp. durum]